MVVPAASSDYSARHHYQQPQVAQSYDRERFTSVWGKGADRLEKRALRRALRLVPPGSVVLELACGTGRMTEVAIRLGYRVVGLDISKGMLSNAVRRVGGEPHLVGLVRGESESIPLRAQCVDAVMTYRFLHHLDPAARRRVYGEIRRVSRRYAVLQFSTTRSVLFWIRQWRDRRRGKETRIALPHARFIQELEAAGFRERKTTFAFPGIAETYVTLLERTGIPGGAE
jgi:ubiquinone/menaquinone biosynthesis C-methylase UbiE